MQALAVQTPQVLVSSVKNKTLPAFDSFDLLPFRPFAPRRTFRPSSCSSLRCREVSKSDASGQRTIRAHALNVGSGSDGYEERQENNDSHRTSADAHHSDDSSKIGASHDHVPNLFPTALVLCACAAGFLLFLFTKGPSSILPALAKSGFTAAFSLIFVSEIGDKTFFIAALLAMQYDKLLVLLGSMGALSLMTILSVIIGRIFHSVPAQFQTTLPIGEYLAVTLLMFFGLKSIKDAWGLPSTAAKAGEPENKESDEFTEAEELVKEKVSKRLSNPLEVLWKSFSLVFFAEWGDRSMLATIALGAAQSPWGVASGAIVGHLLATSIAILGGAFLAKYISEKLVGYIGGVLFLVFAVATFFGFF
ncbi:GDT1-like protein 2- chloroplastic [Striga hermonthica]|uniref:GDT1 family protein n=1 Tax=Striga hermonthica TaxID=68872 RepID=A0A9N7MJ48_STRHE|nr:GDT1-like protein 2- chloroplastic [Striga hermonthica]